MTKSVKRNMNEVVGTHHLLFITLDTLRFDVAQNAFSQGQLSTLSRWLPGEGWQRRHTPANFTYAAHHAFFSGFLPTSIDNETQPRLFASAFPGSETIDDSTCVFEEATMVEGLANRGYATHCIGGVGFFNKRTALGTVLPGLFQHSYWDEELGVTNPGSTECQVDVALKIIADNELDQRMFLFMNVSALHQPNCHYLEGETTDNVDSQQAALVYVDRSLARLFAELESSAPWFVVVCSDHGTAYGENGRDGHRWNHPVIGEVPYVDFLIR